jgi:hypothetical protein
MSYSKIENERIFESCIRCNVVLDENKLLENKTMCEKCTHEIQDVTGIEKLAIDTSLIASQASKLVEKFNRIESDIQMNCETLEIKIDLKTESMVQLLHKNREDLLDQVKIFKTEKLSNKIYHENISNLMEEVENFKIDLRKKGESLEIILEKARILKGKLNSKHEYIDDFLNSNLIFQEKFLESESFVGSLNKISSPLSNAVTWQHCIDYRKLYSTFSNSFARINNYDLVALCTSYYPNIHEYKLEIYMGNEKKNEMTMYFFNNFCINRTNLFNIYRRINDQPSDKTVIDSYDLLTLELLKSKTIETLISELFANDDKVYLITKPFIEPIVLVYNTNLEHLYSFGLNFSYQYNQYVLKSRNIIINNSLIFVQNHDQIDIFDEKYGNLKITLNLNQDPLQESLGLSSPQELFKFTSKTSREPVKVFEKMISISESNEIFTYNAIDRCIRCYNLEGTKIDKFQISDIDTISSIQITSNKRVLINDQKNFKLYLNK